MSRLVGLPVVSSELALAPRAKALPRRLHAEPDPDLAELSSEEAAHRKLQAKQRLHRLCAELASLRGTLSGRDLAELWLGSRMKEGTVRCWKNLRDVERYPRSEDLNRLEHLINVERERRFGGAFK